MTTLVERRTVEVAMARAMAKRAARSSTMSYAQDPVGFVTERLGAFAWSKQREILEAVRDHRRVAVQSCHGVGKSWDAACTVAWWLAERPDAFVVTTAPTFRQVRAILWREIGKAHRKGNLPGRVNQTEWWIGDELVAFGTKPQDDDTEAFQGIHAANLLVVIDEAAGVSKTIFDAADTLLSNEAAHILVIGNPDDPLSQFARVCAVGSVWHTISISAMDSPAWTGEEVPGYLTDLLVSKLWEQEMADEHGVGSPWYISRVLGEFPEDTEDGVIPLSGIRRCQSEDAYTAPTEWIGCPWDVTWGAWVHVHQVELGMDVGAGGDDTTIRARRGPRAGRTWREKTPDPADALDMVAKAIRESRARVVKVDAIGVGWAIVAPLRKMGLGVEVVEVKVSWSPHGPKAKEQYAKLRDQIWYEVGRKLTTDGAWDLSELDDVTVSQLIAPTYGFDSSGKIKVEQKAETKKRIGRSPDDADALLLAYYKGRPKWSL